MKTNKLVAIALGFFFSAGVMAQNEAVCIKTKKSPEERAKKQTEWLNQELKLNDEQKQKVEAINLKYAQENVADRKAAKEKFKANRAAKDAEMQQVLTAEQYAQLKELKNKKKDCKHGKKEGKKHHKKAAAVEQQVTTK
ncbi:MAG: DUF4890 domain-containing protein [Prevotellaceae bacterium]|jgi:Spy/CpxP family protein refolding chaperone|nr:DUF4890 domain-containing protein [Prevotellaceae bacterium]